MNLKRNILKFSRGYFCECFLCSNSITPDKMKMNGVDAITDTYFNVAYMNSKSLAFSSWKEIFEQLRQNWALIAAYENYHPKNLSRNMEMLIEENERIFHWVICLASFPCSRRDYCIIQK